MCYLLIAAYNTLITPGFQISYNEIEKHLTVIKREVEIGTLIHSDQYFELYFYS